MGLDMYLYRARKLKKKEINAISEKTRNEIGEIDSKIFVLPVEECEEDMVSDLKPFLTPLKYKNEYFDTGKIADAVGIKADVNIVSICYGEKIRLSLAYENKAGDRKSTAFEFLRKDIDKYTRVDEEEGYAVYMTEVGYWRKAYDLQEELYELYPRQIQNCGFHAVNTEMMQAMREAGLKGVRYSDNLFYHEWY